MEPASIGPQEVTEFTLQNFQGPPRERIHFVIDFLATQTRRTRGFEELEAPLNFLRTADLEQAGVDEAHWKTMGILYRVFPTLRSQGDEAGVTKIKVIMNGYAVSVPKNELLKIEYFRMHYRFEHKDKIVIDDPNFSSTAIKAFCNYFSEDGSVITQENSLELLHLAHQFLDENLENSILHFLSNTAGIHTGNVIAFLHAGIKLDYPDLTLLCLNYLWNICEEEWRDLNEKYESEFLDTVKILRENGALRTGCFANSEPFELICEHRALPEAILPLLDRVCTWCPVKLTLQGLSLTDQECATLLEKLPHLSHIKMNAISRITLIASLGNLQTLYCQNCYNLKTIQFQGKTKIQLAGCFKVESVDAPFVEDIELIHCLSLESMHIPQAKKGSWKRCEKMTEVKAQAMENASFEDCTNLETVLLPQAKRGTWMRCLKLIQVEAPSMENAYFDTCENLETLILPQAKSIEMYNNMSLKTIQGPLVIEATFVGKLFNIREINLPKAEKIKLSSILCPQPLTFFYGKTILIKDCFGLASLKVVMATNIIELSPGHDFTRFEVPSTCKITPHTNS